MVSQEEKAEMTKTTVSLSPDITGRWMLSTVTKTVELSYMIEN